MRVPSKSKNAPTEGPSGLRSTSSTSASTSGRYPKGVLSGFDDGDGALGAIRHRELGFVHQVGGDVVDQGDAVAFVVGLEHLGGQHVTAAVAGAGVSIDS